MLNLTIFLALAAGLMIFLKWYVRKEIFDPLFLAPLYWIGFITFSIIISIALDLRFNWTGILPIVLFLLAFIIGSAIMKHLESNVRIEKIVTSDGNTAQKVFSPGRLKWIIIVFSFLGILAIYLQLQFLDIQIRSFSDVIKAATKISTIRYNGGVDIPKYVLLLMSFLYTSAFLGGIYFVISKGIISKLVSLLPFAVIIVFTLTNGVKAGFLFLLIIWISGFVSAYIYHLNGQIKNVKRLFYTAMIALVFVFGLIPVTQFFRAGKQDDKIKFISPGIVSYFVSFNAFTIWYDSYKNDRLTGFKYTLSGAHNYFYGERELGLYGTDNVIVGNYEKSPVETNVYTMARGLIEDFTLFGATFIMLIIGMMVQLLYVLSKRKRMIPMCFLALFYSILFCSFAQNIINYNTILLSWIISIGIIFLVRKRAKTSPQTSETD